MKIYFYLCTIAACFSLTALARGGGDSVGNGGDRIAGEFVTTARTTIQTLSSLQLGSDLQNIVHTLAINVDLVKVNSKKGLILSGAPVDAINYPDTKHILVDRTRWSQNPNLQSMDTKRLVLHEYLGVSNFDDSTYAISGRLIHVLEVANLGQLQSVKQALMNFDFGIKGLIHTYQFAYSSLGGQAAKNQTCYGVSSYQEESDAAFQALSMNKEDLEADGITNLEEFLKQLTRYRPELATLCADPNSDPSNMASFLNQIQDMSTNMLSLFNP